MLHALCVPPADLDGLTRVDWSTVVATLAERGWVRLARAADEPLRTQLREAALRGPEPRPKSGGDGHVQLGGLSAHEALATTATIVQRFAQSLTDGINGALSSRTLPIPHFNHAEWATTTPDGVGFITPHRDPPSALGVVAITTLEGVARFCVWDDDATDLRPAQHRDDTAHQWDTGDGDLVILRCDGWPSADARSPVHEVRSPPAGGRRTLTLRHNRNGYGADYFT
jgi:hypothetical protein